MNLLGRFLALSGTDRRLFICAWCLLGYYKLAITLRPVMNLIGHLERVAGTEPAPEADAFEQDEAARIGRMVARAAAHTPWPSLCLVQVLTTQRLMASRKLPGQFTFGAMLCGDRSAPDRKLAAHAWLRCGDLVVSGAGGHENYAPTWAFRW
ncbi:lasso peptide biosynthesis B2 protein [Halioglobus maricola]|uniref:Lasso peptide biosynthesis B2 protein n=1 Tax=Halioglobus maricola TaxID=2601894 RepID=A0A5P9NFL7_9GAMM|nr:lasso peptide biosynthesis B2 protein [Halioglobus maricola]QFU74593.1 lasso peptide biosynthesis B2 protein [Halioglobus maricola]